MACHTCDPACANMLNWEGLGHCALGIGTNRKTQRRSHSLTDTMVSKGVSSLVCIDVNFFLSKDFTLDAVADGIANSRFFFSSKSSLENSEAHSGKFLVHCCKFPVSWGTGVSSCPVSSVLSCNGALTSAAWQSLMHL